MLFGIDLREQGVKQIRSAVFSLNFSLCVKLSKVVYSLSICIWCMYIDAHRCMHIYISVSCVLYCLYILY